MEKLHLRAARINAGLTQKEVAALLNVSKNTVVSWEKYRTAPAIDTAKRLAKIYGKSVDSIIFFAE